MPIFTDGQGIEFGVMQESGRPTVSNYVWNTSSLTWVRMTQPLISTDTLTVAGSMSLSAAIPSGTNTIGKVYLNPMVDYDVTLSYGSGLLTGIVITGGGQTKTMVLGWTGTDLTSIATTIT
jgi:hypothetical protein